MGHQLLLEYRLFLDSSAVEQQTVKLLQFKLTYSNTQNCNDLNKIKVILHALLQLHDDCTNTILVGGIIKKVVDEK